MDHTWTTLAPLVDHIYGVTSNESIAGTCDEGCRRARRATLLHVQPLKGLAASSSRFV